MTSDGRGTQCPRISLLFGDLLKRLSVLHVFYTVKWVGHKAEGMGCGPSQLISQNYSEYEIRVITIMDDIKSEY